jgi:hypothetical protein
VKPEDFPQFDDPRVREVMAAASNLVEWLTTAKQGSGWMSVSDETAEFIDLKTALFAAQHSRPKEVNIDCPACKSPHIDEGEWATTRLHKTHQCQTCKYEWRPFPYHTVGVAQHSKPKEPSLIERLVEEMIAGDEEAMRRLRHAFFEGKATPSHSDHGMMCACPKCVYK